MPCTLDHVCQIYCAACIDRQTCANHGMHHQRLLMLICPPECSNSRARTLAATYMHVTIHELYPSEAFSGRQSIPDRGVLQVLEAFQQIQVPKPGEELEFAPDPGLQPIHYMRPVLPAATERLRRTAVDAAESEAAEALAVWTVAALASVLSLENILLVLTCMSQPRCTLHANNTFRDLLCVCRFCWQQSRSAYADLQATSCGMLICACQCRLLISRQRARITMQTGPMQVPCWSGRWWCFAPT